MNHFSLSNSFEHTHTEVQDTETNIGYLLKINIS